MKQSKQIHVKAIGGQSLVEVDIPKAIKQAITFAAEGVHSWFSHMLDNAMTYEACQNVDVTFLTQIPFEIDLNVHVHLRSCKAKEERNDLNDHVLIFSTSHLEAETRKFFHVIPDVLKQN